MQRSPSGASRTCEAGPSTTPAGRNQTSDIRRRTCRSFRSSSTKDSSVRRADAETTCGPAEPSDRDSGQTRDAENRRILFDPEGRLAPILKRRNALGPSAFVFGSPAGEYVDRFKTAWESLLLVANGHDTKRAKHGARVDRRNSDKSTCTGTTSVTKAPAGSWPMEWTSVRSS